jgi:spore coat polysaccharide biosynthesis protein SpsF (cytidylyltransferase family)
MVVSDFYIFGMTILPLKTNPPLVINADRVLAHTSAAEIFESITRRQSQVFYNRCRSETVKFHDGSKDDACVEFFGLTFFVNTLRVFAGEVLNHSMKFTQRGKLSIRKNEG